MHRCPNAALEALTSGSSSRLSRCSVLSRVHAAYAVVKERAERAEARLEVAEAQMAQERAAAEAYKVGGRLRMAQWLVMLSMLEMTQFA